jgi:hypothetical protein
MVFVSAVNHNLALCLCPDHPRPERILLGVSTV